MIRHLRVLGLCLASGAVATLTGAAAALPFTGWTEAVTWLVVGSSMAVLLGAAIGAARKDSR